MKQTFKIPDGCKEVTIEQVDNQIITTFEPEKSKKRWRAECYSTYYYMCIDFTISIYTESNDATDNELYNIGNYFQTKEQAEQYRDFMLKKSLEFNTNNK